MRKSFTWFLSLLVLLAAFAGRGYAQETQETVELYAEEASYCFNEADDYTVTISVRDFIKLSEFELALVFNDAIFEYTGSSNAHSSLSGVTVSEDGGVIDILWDGTTTTIGDNNITEILRLHFSVVGFPGNVVSPLESDMNWGTTEFWYTTDEGDDNVNTDESFDGSLTVNVEPGAIETTIATESCFGGDVTLTVTEPDADMYLFNEDPDPADWVWSSSPDFQAAAGEVVTVRVKDANDCMSIMETVDIPETVDPVSFTVTTQDPTCFGGNGSVVVDAKGGIADYEYYINSSASLAGATLKTNFQWSQGPGTYYVAVQDANDCVDLGDAANWEQITIIDENTEITGNVTLEDVTCNGGSDGSISVEILEGGSAATDDYQVSLDGGLTWGDVGVYTHEELTAGSYAVEVRNSEGCIVAIDNVTITEPAAMSFDVSVEDVQCGGDDDGEIAVTNITGGTSPYTLEIEESGNVTTETGVDATGYTFAGLMPTYYSLTITDANGCEVEYSNPNATGNVIAVQSPEDIQFDVTISDPTCYNDAVSVEITNVTGGSGSYVYSFDGGTTWVDTTTVDEWMAPYSAMDVTVADADNTCPVTQTIDEDDVDNPDAALTATVSEVFPPTCIDGNDGNIYLNISGGVAPYYYSINNSAWRESNYDDLAIIRVGVGTHTINVVDERGCEIETEITTTVTLDENVINASSDLIIDCYGDKTGTISVNFSFWADGLAGGEGEPEVPVRDVEFYVENEEGQVASFEPSNLGAAQEDITTFTAGTYIVWVVDQYTCESNPDTIEVIQNNELLIADVVANGASCFGTFEGTITIHATGGNATPLEYAVVNNQGALGNIEDDKWLDFETYDPETDLSTVSFQVDGGTYWIAVRDDGCDMKTYGPIDVTGYEELLVNEAEIEENDPLCNGDANGSIVVPIEAVSGGAGAYMFTLLDDAGDEMEGYVDLSTGEFNDLPAGIYQVLVEDAEDCPSYTTEDITLTEPPVLSFTADYQHIRCEGTNDGTITVTASGGTPGYWYAINNQNTWIAFADDTNTKTYIATEPGTFRVWVKDANNCVSGPDTITITQPEQLGADISVTQDVSCYGGDDGAISVIGTGGWAGITEYEFKLNDGTWTNSTTFTGLSAGEDTLYIRDVADYSIADYDTLQALDCVDTVIFTMEEPDPIVYDVDVNEVKCRDGADGALTVEVLSGGTPFVDEDGDNDGFLVRVTGSGYDEEYYTGADNTVTFDNLVHSMYTVYITDAAGCTLAPTTGDTESPYSTIESWEVAEPDTYLEFEATFMEDASCYGAEDGKFEVEAQGGVPPYQYYAGLSVEPDGHVLVPSAPDAGSDEWQDTTVFEVGAGTWVVWVMDANGCILGGQTDELGNPVNEWRVQIEQPEEIVWEFHMPGEGDEVHYFEPSCYGEWDGEIHIQSITGGTETYSARVWGTTADSAMMDSTYTNIEMVGGLYRLGGVPASAPSGFEVTVMDANDCVSDVDTIVIDQPEELIVELETAEGAFTCAGAVEGFIEANATGGNGGYEYQLWKNDVIHTPWQDAGSAFLVQVGNEFVVEVRDSEGCTASDTIYIETPLEVEFTVEDLTCYGDEKASLRVNAQGTPDRMFRVFYTDTESDESNTTDWFESSIDIMNEFRFDTDNLVDVHYEIYVEDEVGCVSLLETVTFDTIQAPLTFDIELVETTECEETYEITSISGGIDPYVVIVNDSVMTEMTFTLGRGANLIQVMDDHYCIADTTIDVAGEYVVRNTTIETYFERSTEFVDEESGVDTMLAVGTHEFVYEYADNCERTLIVEVIEVSPAEDIKALQGETSSSPWVGYLVELDGTITGISRNEGFFMQDANAAWSGVWVSYGETAGLAIGDGVLVKGEAAEVASVTTINAEEVTEADAPVEVEGIVVATPTDAKAEMYESVLVTVEDGTATTVNEATGEWTIYYDSFDNIIVNDLLYGFVPIEDHVYHVTGIVNGRLDMFKLEPRRKADIVPANIESVQSEADESPWVASDVNLVGTITGVSVNEGFFMQDANEAWSGIWVAWSDTEGLEVGDGAEVTGAIAEVASVTTVNATMVTEVDPILTVEPVVVSTPDEVEQEMYESVLVTVEGAKATSADDVTGEWTIYHEAMQDLTVNDLLFGYSPEEGNFYHVTGVVNGRLDAFKLEPRMEEDIVDLSATPNNDIADNIQFKVYPNPFSERIIIENNHKLTRVVISNVAGQRVMDIEYPNNEIRTANLVSGVYIISLFTEDGIAKSERIVKR